MRQFSISRLETRSGIFRLAGEIDFAPGPGNIQYRLVQFMGTDGWCELDLSTHQAQALLAAIEPEVIALLA